ncbi:MAG: M23 family metallopeptidase [Candidatus Coatesbacteria bacterium]|nr:MAG: M23 family metallopeptidase [Candidatus Coatesbacteria bacterium]
MLKRDYTIMICSHSSGRVRSIYLPRSVLAAAAVFSSSFIIGAVAVGVTLYYNYRAMDRAVRPTFDRNQELTAENLKLGADVERRDEVIADLSFRLQKERDDYALRVEELDGVLKKMDKFYTDLRIIAGFKLDAKSAKELGSGGPGVKEEDYFDSLYRLDEERFRREAVRHEGKLRGECAGYEREFLVLRRLLERRKSLLADVPDTPPVKGVITSYFGARRWGGRIHGGLDLAAPVGTAVRAPAEGVVTAAGPYPYYGRVIFIDHGGGFTTRYGHLSSAEVKKGDRVERGDIVGRVGATGLATGSHLHYEVRLNGIPVDPYNYLNCKLPIHIVDGSRLKVVEIPEEADLLIPDEVFEAYEAKAAPEGADSAPAAGVAEEPTKP